MRSQELYLKNGYISTFKDLADSSRRLLRRASSRQFTIKSIAVSLAAICLAGMCTGCVGSVNDDHNGSLELKDENSLAVIEHNDSATAEAIVSPTPVPELILPDSVELKPGDSPITKVTVSCD